MECSPTCTLRYRSWQQFCRSPRQLWNALLHINVIPRQQRENVAVPVNYGMLSYVTIADLAIGWQSRSPRQLWNALLRGDWVARHHQHRRSPRQLWNALLPSLFQSSEQQNIATKK